MLHKIDWDKAYREERQLPWDTGLVAPELAAYIKEHAAGKSGNDNARIKNALVAGTTTTTVITTITTATTTMVITTMATAMAC